MIFSSRARAYRRVERKEMIDRTHKLAVSRQCQLLEIGAFELLLSGGAGETGGRGSDAGD